MRDVLLRVAVCAIVAKYVESQIVEKRSGLFGLGIRLDLISLQVDPRPEALSCQSPRGEVCYETFDSISYTLCRKKSVSVGKIFRRFAGAIGCHGR